MAVWQRVIHQNASCLGCRLCRVAGSVRDFARKMDQLCHRRSAPARRGSMPKGLSFTGYRLDGPTPRWCVRSAGRPAERVIRVCAASALSRAASSAPMLRRAGQNRPCDAAQCCFHALWVSLFNSLWQPSRWRASRCRARYPLPARCCASTRKGLPCPTTTCVGCQRQVTPYPAHLQIICNHQAGGALFVPQFVFAWLSLCAVIQPRNAPGASGKSFHFSTFSIFFLLLLAKTFYFEKPYSVFFEPDCL